MDTCAPENQSNTQALRDDDILKHFETTRLLELLVVAQQVYIKESMLTSNIPLSFFWPFFIGLHLMHDVPEKGGESLKKGEHNRDVFIAS
jgi:hypothetical protein